MIFTFGKKKSGQKIHDLFERGIAKFLTFG